MAVMPGAGSAIFELSKLADYCLSETHPRGRPKARVFRTALGIDAADADWLRRALLEGLAACEAAEIATDVYGIRWRADNKQAVGRTIWLLRGGEPPRFLTCWVL